MRIDLVIIDPQNDFCDPNGSLFVSGANHDMTRLAGLIKRLKGKLDNIHVTLDSHQKVHIAHPIFWRNSQGQHPAPFTIISVDDVKNGVWTPTKPRFFKWGLSYVESLAKGGKYPLCIWPEHCKIGTWGQGVYQPVMEALDEWQGEFATVDWVTKGSNILTEHYSAIVADVPNPEDPKTLMNVDFLNTVNEADVVLLAGEAGSHCLANTGRDAVAYFKDNSFVKKLVLLQDATSPVPSFESLQESFIKDMTALGMQVTTCADYLA